MLLALDTATPLVSVALHDGERVVVEHSDRQGQTCPALFLAQGGWADVQDHRDLAGRDRFVTATWTGDEAGQA